MTTDDEDSQMAVHQALFEARPSFMTDGHGLRGPNPRLGQDVRSIDGADGGFGSMQIKQQRGGREESEPGNSSPPGTLLKDVVYLDTDDETLYYTDVYTDGRKDAV